jgi:thymidylate synthase (FAD)
MNSSKVELVSVSPDAEKMIAYCARVSNPKNQYNDDFAGLMKFCIRERHWSIFQMADMTVEINCQMPIATQILRHRSFEFQQFSQRYADATELNLEIPIPDLRRQDTKNRQNSTDDLEGYLKLTLQEEIRQHFEASKNLYQKLLSFGVAKECSRFVLPGATMTRLYMKGSLRSWITYIALREKNGTQLEHKEVAKACKAIFVECFPTIANALGGLETDWVI